MSLIRNKFKSNNVTETNCVILGDATHVSFAGSADESFPVSFN